MARTAKKDDDGIKIICRNKRAFHEYEIHETLECGLVLTGTEVKSLREGSGGLEDAYGKLDEGELWLIGSDIPEYSMGNRMNHKPKRPRKLLLHRREIAKLLGRWRLASASSLQTFGCLCPLPSPKRAGSKDSVLSAWTPGDKVGVAVGCLGTGRE